VCECVNVIVSLLFSFRRFFLFFDCWRRTVPWDVNDERRQEEYVEEEEVAGREV